MRDPPVTVHAGPPLLAVAHGSRDPRAAATIRALLYRVRTRRPDLRVEPAFLDHTPPSVGQALAALAGEGHDEVVVLPLLLTAAYHSTTDIPTALAEARERHPRMRVGYGDTLGPHPLLLSALQRRLAQAGVSAVDPDTAVVLAAAGASDPAANATIAAIAAQWQARGWPATVPAYASAASPTPAEAVARLRATGALHVVVASYFLAPGYFADTVREATLAAGADAVAPVLGSAPELTYIVLERYHEARRRPARPLLGGGGTGAPRDRAAALTVQPGPASQTHRDRGVSPTRAPADNRSSPMGLDPR